jgi:deoxycytidine triphosphate deaminase
MSTLGPEVLLDSSIYNPPVVERLSSRDTKTPEGAGVDLQVGEVWKQTGEAYLGLNERIIASMELVAKYNPDKEDEDIFTIKPGEVYTLVTVEKVNMPKNLTASLSLRRTGYSAAIFLSSGNVAPGYKGELSVTIKNDSQYNFKFALGARLLFLTVDEVIGATEYKGQWQNNDMQRTGKETQI